MRCNLHCNSDVIDTPVNTECLCASHDIFRSIDVFVYSNIEFVMHTLNPL